MLTKTQLKELDRNELVEMVSTLQKDLYTTKKHLDYVEEVKDAITYRLREMETALNEKVELPTINLAVYSQLSKEPVKRFVESDAIRQDILNVLVSNIGDKYSVSDMTNILTRKYSTHSNLYRTVWTVAKDKGRMVMSGYEYHYDDGQDAHQFWITRNNGARYAQCTSCKKEYRNGTGSSINITKSITITGTTYKHHEIIVTQGGQRTYYIHYDNEGKPISVVPIPSNYQEQSTLENHGELVSGKW